MQKKHETRLDDTTTTTNIADRYRRWFEYEKDAHGKVLASLHNVAAERRSSPSFQKAVDLFAHIMAARWLWLFRFGVVAEAPHDIFPNGVSLETLDSLAEQMHAAWSTYLDRMDDSQVARVFDYRSLDGPEYRNSVEDILTQLFGHSLYHRGQIALLLRSAGAEPAATDFVFWSREPVHDQTE